MMLSIRLPETLERKLAIEAERVHKKRSELAREVIADYLHRQERDRFIGEFMAEARALARDPKARREAREIAEEDIPFGNEALNIAEGRAPGESWPEESGERWWEK